MSIYNTTDLQNNFIVEQSSIAFAHGFITEKEFEEIKTNHTSQLYTPNMFVVLGLLLLTFLIVFGAAGLGALLFGPLLSNGSLFLILSLTCYAALEYMCGVKKHKNSGTDLALMTTVSLSFIAGLDTQINNRGEEILLSFLLFLLFSWFTYRYVNVLSGIAGAITLIIFVFNLYSSFGDFTIFTFPFVLIALSGCMYLFCKSKMNVSNYFAYHTIFKVISIVSIIALYASGNYFVVATIVIDNYIITSQSALSYGLFFWLWTFVIPVFYFYLGCIKKDILLIRVGVLLIIFSFITYRYYHQIVDIEFILIIAGVLLIIVSYYLMQVFKNGKFGFIYRETISTSSKFEDLEAFAVSQLALPNTPPDETTKFGEGSFGGAGSGSNY